MIKHVRECYNGMTKFLSAPGLPGFPTVAPLSALIRVSLIHSTNTIRRRCSVPEDAKSRGSKNTQDMRPALQELTISQVAILMHLTCSTRGMNKIPQDQSWTDVAWGSLGRT